MNKYIEFKEIISDKNAVAKAFELQKKNWKVKPHNDEKLYAELHNQIRTAIIRSSAFGNNRAVKEDFAGKTRKQLVDNLTVEMIVNTSVLKETEERKEFAHIDLSVKIVHQLAEDLVVNTYDRASRLSTQLSNTNPKFNSVKKLLADPEAVRSVFENQTSDYKNNEWIILIAFESDKEKLARDIQHKISNTINDEILPYNVSDKAKTQVRDRLKSDISRTLSMNTYFSQRVERPGNEFGDDSKYLSRELDSTKEEFFKQTKIFAEKILNKTFDKVVKLDKDLNKEGEQPAKTQQKAKQLRDLISYHSVDKAVTDFYKDYHHNWHNEQTQHISETDSRYLPPKADDDFTATKKLIKSITDNDKHKADIDKRNEIVDLYESIQNVLISATRKINPISPEKQNQLIKDACTELFKATTHPDTSEYRIDQNSTQLALEISRTIYAPALKLMQSLKNPDNKVSAASQKQVTDNKEKKL